MVEGKDPGLPDILPPIATLRETMQRLSQNSHEILTPIETPSRPKFNGLSDFLAWENSHKILTNLSDSKESETTLPQDLEATEAHQNSHFSHDEVENGKEKFSSPTAIDPTSPPDPTERRESLSESSLNFSHPPRNSEKNEKLQPQNRRELVTVGGAAEFPGERKVGKTEKEVRKTEKEVRKTENTEEPDFSTFPHRSSGDILPHQIKDYGGGFPKSL